MASSESLAQGVFLEKFTYRIATHHKLVLHVLGKCVITQRVGVHMTAWAQKVVVCLVDYLASPIVVEYYQYYQGIALTPFLTFCSCDVLLLVLLVDAWISYAPL